MKTVINSNLYAARQARKELEDNIIFGIPCLAILASIFYMGGMALANAMAGGVQ
jgi:hypothetical protein